MELLIALRIRQFRFLMALGRLVKAEGLVCEQFLAHGKHGRKKGERDDDSEWQQFWWDLLQCPQAPRDCVCAVLIFLHP